MFAVWRMYEPHGWPALFLWGRGGALRWYHLGEGDYAGTEEAIREALEEAGARRDWPPTVEPLRPSDAPGTEVIAPTPEHFPGGSTEEPWVASTATPSIELSYEAGGAYAAVDGVGEIAVTLDDAEREPVRVSDAGLVELAVHQRTQRHLLELSPSPELRIYSIQFAAAPAR
jgi:hypothetical protein